MRPPSHTTPLDGHFRAAWQAQAAAVQTPALLPDLMHHQPELRARVAASYTQLRALPRRVRRALQRQWGLPLAGVALVLALGQSPLQAATIRVNARCTLVDAIRAASSDTARGGCRAGQGADTIVLPAGSTQTLRRVHDDTYGPTGLPVIRSKITIAGQGSTIVRDSGAPVFRIVAVASTGDLTLSETTVSGGVPLCCTPGSGGGVINYGTLIVTDSTIAGNAAFFGGGGVDNLHSGTLTVTNSTIANNGANYYNGGGVRNAGTLTVTNSTISGNAVGDSGGGGVANSGIMTVSNSTIVGNAAGEYDGGGVANSGILTVTNSTISGNSTEYNGGGGVSNGGTMRIMNSTITGNEAIGRFGYGTGGGVSNGGGLTVMNSTISGNTAGYDGYGTGGGVANSGVLTVMNSTISGNTAGFGGGIASPSRNGYGALIADSTITGNSATSLGGGVSNSSNATLARTLVSGNTAPFGPEIFNYGRLHADDHNLFGVNGNAGVEGFDPGPTDVVPSAGVRLRDILRQLADNGGPTQTHRLVPGSPALDAVPLTDPACTGTDQRGVPRPQGVGCDIGAFERRVQ